MQHRILRLLIRFHSPEPFPSPICSSPFFLGTGDRRVLKVFGMLAGHFARGHASDPFLHQRKEEGEGARVGGLCFQENSARLALISIELILQFALT